MDNSLQQHIYQSVDKSILEDRVYSGYFIVTIYNEQVERKKKICRNPGHRKSKHPSYGESILEAKERS